MDVGGYDAKFKLVIAAAHAYGVIVEPETGVQYRYTKPQRKRYTICPRKNLKIKLVPVAKELDARNVALFVLPKFVNESEFLYNVEYEYNGVTVQAAFADQQFFFGKGAGGHPTGSAVLSDIAALRYDYGYEYKKAKEIKDLQFTNNVEINIYLRYEDEALVEALGFEHKRALLLGSYKFVIGKINLQKLIDNQQRISDNKAFVAFADQLTGVSLAPAKIPAA
jgi:homoserine dehydrogenase